MTLAQVLQVAHPVLDTVGALVTLPMLGTMILGVRYIDQIKNTAESTNRALLAFMAEAKEHRDDTEKRMRKQEGMMAVVWDGHERRHAREED